MSRCIVLKTCKKSVNILLEKCVKVNFGHFFLEIHGPINHRWWRESCTRQAREAKNDKIIKIRQENKTNLKMLFPCSMGSCFFFDSRRGFFSKR